jgi:hypothetical protein
MQEREPVAAPGFALDTGLALLRAGAGLSLFLLFGVPKPKDAAAFWHSGHWQFVDFNRKVVSGLFALSEWAEQSASGTSVGRLVALPFRMILQSDTPLFHGIKSS